jgi:spore germination cell wall hydrolase CwlJ-like protein
MSLVATLAFAVFGTSGAKAHPQDLIAQVTDAQGAVAGAASPVIDPKSTNPAQPTDIPVQPLRDATIDPAIATDGDSARSPAASLAELVDLVQIPDTVSPDIACLAGAIYFEAKSESLAGQLAVGRVIVARTASGHFPSSYCGVVFQHSQFSFVRGGAMPTIDRSSRTWRQVVKIALIADRGAWKSPAEGALFFHAARVGPVAGRTRVARIDNHVFYR